MPNGTTVVIENEDWSAGILTVTPTTGAVRTLRPAQWAQLDLGPSDTVDILAAGGSADVWVKVADWARDGVKWGSRTLLQAKSARVPITSGAFITLTQMDPADYVTAGGGGGGSSTSTFQIESLFPTVTVIGSSDPSGVGLNHGTVFTVTVPAKLTAIRFNRSNAAAATSMTASIYGASGTALASKTISTTTVGWQTATLDTPIDLAVGTTYTVAYHQVAAGGNIYYTDYPSFHSSGRVAKCQTGRAITTGGAYLLGDTPAKPTNASTSCMFVDPVIDFLTSGSALRPPGYMDDPADGYPALAGYPDVSNTGIPDTTPLTIVSGLLRSERIGQLLAGFEVWGQILVTHNNVVVQNCRAYGNDFHTVYCQDNPTGVAVRDCKIRSFTLTDGANGVYGAATVERCNIAICDNAVVLTVPSTIRDNYFHAFAIVPGSIGSPHYDGVESDGSGNHTIQHNTVLLNQDQTSAIQINNYFGDSHDILVTNNYLAGGGYTVAVRTFGTYLINNITITNNKLRIGQFGYSDIQVGPVPPNALPIWTGNTDAVTSAAVPGP